MFDTLLDIQNLHAQPCPLGIFLSERPMHRATGSHRLLDRSGPDRVFQLGAAVPQALIQRKC